VTYLQVDQYGMVDVAELESALKPSTILITIMQANNEVGTIQPIEEIAGIARQRGILFHTDAAQSTGKIPVKVNEMQVDLLSVAGHKFYASKGIGALYIRQGTKLEKQIHGAGHEYGLRAGTENVPYIAGLGCASQLADENLSSISNHTREMRDRLYQILKNEMPSIRLNGHPQRRLPNTLSLGFPEIEAEKLLSETPAIAASAGSACHSGSGEISPVLKAMKVPAQYARGTIRFSTGKYTSSDEIETAAKEIIKSVKRLISAQ
jgi:cysteine desulfurase